MSRFLKKRHYKLVLPGIRRMMQGTDESLHDVILWYMNMTQVSFTEQDTAEIQTMYLSKFPNSGHTPNTFNSQGEQL